MSLWKEIKTFDEWDDLFHNTTQRPLLILKHSTACPISSEALREFEAHIESNLNENVVYGLVKVIESRPVSNKIAEDLSIKHESPQILYIKNMQSFWNASHWDITRNAISDAIDVQA